MFITKMALPRRTFLRGVGTTLALPLLEGMIPAFTALAKTAAKPVNRLSYFYVPNGMIMDQWTPAAEGAQFALTPILAPLAPFRDRLVVLSGLSSKAADRHNEDGGGHAKDCAAFLTGVCPKRTEGTGIEAGISADQIAAKALGGQTQIASLEIGLEPPQLAGNCVEGYACAYVNTLSWLNSTTQLPMEINPRAIFERLFGDGGSTAPAVRLARIQEDRSILDSVSEKVARLQSTLGSGDRAKLSQYLDALRDIERRIGKAEEQVSQELPEVDRPIGVPATFEEHAQLMFDLQVLAYQCDLTRVITFMLGREISVRTYASIGVPDAHHPISHHGYDPEKMAKCAKVNTYHSSLFASFLQKLQSTPDGDGSLLDHMMIVYGAGMSNSHLHDPLDLPILLAGGGAGAIKGGRHVRYPKDTPLPNLHLSLLDKLGVHVDTLGDSTGAIEHLSV